MNRDDKVAFKPIKYANSMKAESELNDGEKPLVQKQIKIGIVVLFLSSIDAFTLFTVIDQLLTEMWIINIVLTVGGALILNILPVILGEFLGRNKYKIGKYNTIYIGILIATFFIFYIATCILRWNTVPIEGENTVDAQNATQALTIFLMIIPLITGVIATFLSFSLNDPLKNKISRYRLNKIKLIAHLNDLKAGERDLLIDEELLIHSEDGYYQAALDSADAKIEGFKRYARFKLAEHLKNPEAVTRLTQEKIV